MVLALPMLGAAQGQTGSVTGVVTDATGGVLPGASVTIRSATGAVSSAVTDSAGRYTIANVAPGSYDLTVELAGFERQTSKVVVAAGRPATVEVRLQIGGQAEAIQVTGTLIPRPSLEAMSPVATMDVEQITYRGQTRIEDILTTLPQVFVAQNSTIANGASGTATVSLRSLGSNRTLVLIDGRRMSAGDAWESAADLNFIPSALVKRVDVLTGGASSVYGADAVAGVVNFVLDKQFEGVRGGIEVTGYQHNNNNTTAQAALKAKNFAIPDENFWNFGSVDANVALGGKFGEGKGHASVYVDYRHTNKFLKADRDYTACSFSLGSSGPICGGSGTIPDGRFMVFTPAPDYELVGDYTLNTAGPGNTFRNRTSADVYNYGAVNFMQRPDERLAAGGFLNYQWNKYIRGNVDVMLMDDYTDAQIAESGDFGNTTLINCDNPLLSAQQRALLCTAAGYGPTDVANVTVLKRNVEGGPRVSQIRHTDFRVIAGIGGDLGRGWNYDFYFMDAEVHSPQSYANDLNINRLQESLLAWNNPETGALECTSGNPSCVPWNIFTVGGVTQAALDYLTMPLLLNSGTKTQVYSGKVTADLKEYNIASPKATEGIKFAAGYEQRYEYMFVNPDLNYREANASGQGGPTLPVEGNYTVKEFFVEGLIPFVQDAKFAKDLSLEVGYRTSDYSSTGRWPTYKFQGSWAPSSDVKIRAGFNRATRSPNIRELYVPQGLGLGGSQDVCAGTNPAFTQAQCANTGVTAAQYGKILENPADQYNTLGGGNPNLNPEIADTWSVGGVITPSKVPGLNVTVDYYNITINDTIGALAADDIINSCVTTGNPTLCNLIHRDRAGTLWLYTEAYTETTNQNIGKLWSEGIDFTGSYTKGLGGGHSISANLIGTYLLSNKIDTGLYTYDCVTYFGNQCVPAPTPTWRHLARISWETPFKTTFSFGWRLVGAVTNDDGSPEEALADPGNIDLLKKNDIYQIATQNYFDFAANYKLNKNFTILGGVNNIFDKEPPLAPGMQENDYGPGFYGTYDPYGRSLFVNLQIQF
jgi:outer membrane receptor protein involved in Fe transport